MTEQDMTCPDGQTMIPTESGYVCVGKPSGVELTRRDANMPTCDTDQTLTWDKESSTYTCVPVPGSQINWSVWAGPGILFGAVFLIVLLLMARKQG